MRVSTANLLLAQHTAASGPRLAGNVGPSQAIESQEIVSPTSNSDTTDVLDIRVTDEEIDEAIEKAESAGSKEKPETRTVAGGSQSKQPGQLSDEEQQQVTELRQRDAEVRRHEQAHLSAAGPYAQGGPTFEYQTGPDGRRYAVGGEVQIDTSPESGDPEATIRKAQVIRAAANAPAEPSSQDRAVAAAAAKMEGEARQQLRAQQQAEQSGSSAEPAGLTQVGRGAAKRSDRADTERTTGLSKRETAEPYDREVVGQILDAIA